jgi:nicotinamidase-related amidase
MVGRSPFFNPALSYSHWIPGFEPLTSEMVFERSMPSCYANREFGHAMTVSGGHVVLAGFSGEAGCLATAVEAFHRGHSVTYLADASASLGLNQIPAASVHETVVELIGLYGEVTTTREWISEQSANVFRQGAR